MVRSLADLRTYIINLERRPDRRSNSEQLARELGLKRASICTAVDGLQLLSKHAGRARVVSAALQRYRCTWTDMQSGTRMRQCQRLPPKKHATRAWSLWGMLGCNLSHIAAWEQMAADGVDVALIMEDDCHLVVSRGQVKKLFRAAMLHLNRKYPSWLLCYLGADPVTGPGRKPNTRCGIRGLQHAGTVYQAHAYVIKRDEAMLVYLRHKMVTEGLIVDAAFKSWLQTPAAAGKAFWFDNPQLIQQGRFGSDVALLAGGKGGVAAWSKTRRELKKRRFSPLTAAQRRLLGSRNRGTRAIPASVKRKTLRDIGRRGGSAMAGGKSSRKEVEKKDRYLRMYHERHGVWPSAREAYSKPPRISYSIYYRVVGRGGTGRV